MIEDKNVPGADPGELIIQYTPLLHKIASRYTGLLERYPSIDKDDLLQAGRIAIYNSQKHYVPNDEATFVTYVSKAIRWNMMRVLGRKSDGTLPEILESLDEPLTDESDETRLDFVPDNTLTAEERIVEQDCRQETAEAVRAAVDRLKNAKQREIITRCWLKEQPKPEAAAEMGIKLKSLQMIDLEARHRLQRDKRLRQYVIPFFHVTRSRFNSTWTSAVEAAVIWREEHLPQYMQDRSVTNDG